MKTTLENAKYKGNIQGRRMYRESRGVWHIQSANRPNESEFTGTLRECEKALRGKLIKMVA